MNKLLLLVLLFTPFTANADCLDTAQNGTGSITLSWTPDRNRSDGSPFLPVDNAGYTVYYTDTTDGTTCARLIPDGNVLNSTFTIHNDRDYNFNVTQLDTTGQESIFSDTVQARVGSPPVVIIRPSSVSDLVVTRIPGGVNHSLNFTPVTTFEDGALLPANAVSKYFLYVNNILSGNIATTDIPYITALNVGLNSVEIETEIFVNDAFIVSERSIAQIVDVVVHTPEPPPNPPTQIKIDIPPGATSILITFGT